MGLVNPGSTRIRRYSARWSSRGSTSSVCEPILFGNPIIFCEIAVPEETITPHKFFQVEKLLKYSKTALPLRGSNCSSHTNDEFNFSQLVPLRIFEWAGCWLSVVYHPPINNIRRDSGDPLKEKAGSRPQVVKHVNTRVLI